MTFRLSVTIDPPGSVFVYEKKKLKAIMRAAATEIAADARKRVRKAAGGGRIYYGSGGSEYHSYVKGRHAASQPGLSPARLTGTLAKSIEAVVSRSGQYARVRSAFYGLFLDKGSAGGIGSGKKGVNGQRNVRSNGVRGKGRGKLIKVVGGRELKPRPFLSAALEAKSGSIGDRIRASIVQDIAFKKMK